MSQLPFIPNQIYNRRADIHSVFGGNWQSGICPSAKYPYIFIFSGKSGHQHGYEDGWDNPNVFYYSGEGQTGDMEFTKGNLALRDHLKNGKRVFLFESVSKGFVRYITELEFYDAGSLPTNDSSGNQRIGIKFFFKRKGAYIPVQPFELDSLQLAADPIANYGFKIPNETEKTALASYRIGQSLYRKRVIHAWQYKCAVTGFDKIDLLRASHIVPWSEANNVERVDPNNGLLLSPTYDALFDNHYISFENTGKIILSESIEARAFQMIGVTGSELIKDLNADHQNYLETHRKRFNEAH